MKKIRIFIIIGMVILIAVTCTYAKGPWRGRVIDAETKQPIEGASVVAVWEKEWAGLGAGAISKFLDANETITDKNGDFEIPWKYFLSVPYFRKIDGPYFTIYKPGYGSFPWHQVSPSHDLVAVFEGSGATVELPKAKNNYERLKFMQHAELPIDAPDTCVPILKRLKENESKVLGY